jgi:hypothetical protein
VPDRNADGAVDAVEFCAQIDNFNYCLSGGNFNENLERLDLTDESATDHGRPAPYVDIAGTASQETNGGSLQDRNNSDVWTPDAAWLSNNQIFTTDCQGYSAANNPRYWLGCHYCADPRQECWIMRMCPRSTGIPGAGGCPGGVPPAIQRIVLYFENNRPN